ncbi:hypothetical protein HOY80DRAFT_1053460 [Tuber brumale]|nr:hypothetical protein HOY80DRAFT_1053460 [Tuber brumale]
MSIRKALNTSSNADAIERIMMRHIPSGNIHWFSTENRLKVVMPSYLHECIGSWILKAIARECSCGLLSNAWDDTMDIMAAPEYQNFVGRHAGSFEEPDMAFVPRIGPGRTKGAPFPSVVVESGWQESTTHHFDDARRWLEGSGNAVRVVLQGKIHYANESGCIHLALSVSRAHPDRLGYIISPTYDAKHLSDSSVMEVARLLRSVESHFCHCPLPHQQVYNPQGSSTGILMSTITPNPQQNPAISLKEFYDDDCPSKMNPETQVPLDLAILRDVAAAYTRYRGYLPA